MLTTDLSQRTYEPPAPHLSGQLGHVVEVEGWKVTGVVEPGLSRGPMTIDGETRPADELVYGSLVKIVSRRSMAIGIVNRLWLANPHDALESGSPMVEIELLGEVAFADGSSGARFQRGVSHYPELGAGILPVTADDVSVIYRRPESSSIAVGTVHNGAGQPAYMITDSLLGKHFAILGTTGSGKSCTVAFLLRTILDAHPNGHVVLLDPHNEYGAAFDDKAVKVATETLALPYWMMNFEEAVATFTAGESPERDTEIRILKEAILESRKEFAMHHQIDGHVTVDAPIPYYLKDVQQFISRGMGKLDKPEGAGPYFRLLARIEALLGDNRFSFMFPEKAITDTMAESLGQLIRVPVSGKPVTIIDLSGVPSEIVDVAVSMLCRTIFDFGVWSGDAQKVPVLLVCEEAHRYAPRDESLSFAPTRRAISRIAKEGRKYGIGLCLVSQRPSELSETILSQCNTVVAMRMSNHNDQEFVARTLPDGMGGLVKALPSLHTQEAIVVGEGVSVPTRVRFDDLGEAHRPQSATAPFARAWREDQAGDAFIHDTVRHWRAQR